MDEKQKLQHALTAFKNSAPDFYRYGDPGYAGKLFSELSEERRRRLVCQGLHDADQDVRCVAQHFLSKLVPPVQSSEELDRELGEFAEEAKRRAAKHETELAAQAAARQIKAASAKAALEREQVIRDKDLAALERNRNALEESKWWLAFYRAENRLTPEAAARENEMAARQKQQKHAYFDQDVSAGGTLDTAVVIHAQQIGSGVGAQYRFITMKHGSRGTDWQLVRQSVMEHDGKHISAVEIELKDERQTTCYFDLSEYFGRQDVRIDSLS